MPRERTRPRTCALSPRVPPRALRHALFATRAPPPERCFSRSRPLDDSSCARVAATSDLPLPTPPLPRSPPVCLRRQCRRRRWWWSADPGTSGAARHLAVRESPLNNEKSNCHDPPGTARRAVTSSAASSRCPTRSGRHSSRGASRASATSGWACSSGRSAFRAASCCACSPAVRRSHCLPQADRPSPPNHPSDRGGGALPFS